MRQPFQKIWSIVTIWLYPKYRKRGIGTKICREVALHFGTEARALGWTTPVSAEGFALLRSLGVDPVKVTIGGVPGNPVTQPLGDF
jgi:ribosomal protein S18 acetylase RimI-like enzyme